MEYNSQTTITEEKELANGATQRGAYHTPKLTDLGEIHFVIASACNVGGDGTLGCTAS